MSTWPQLEVELDQWRSAGRCVTFWWRDDDLTQISSAFKQLLSITSQFSVPVSIAAIPDKLEVEAARCLTDTPEVSVLQHGFRHANHAPIGEKRSEFGGHRAIDQEEQDICEGRKRLSDLLDDDRPRLFVPPWNRIADATVRQLAGLGLAGLSRFKARRQKQAAPDLIEANTHCDPVTWDDGRRFAGETAALGQLVDHLSRRRTGVADAEEPTGLLTHHLVMDDATWQFCKRLLALTNERENVRWIGVDDILAPGQ